MVTNKDHYLNEILDNFCNHSVCDFIRRHVHGGDCSKVVCEWECRPKVAKWMVQEYKGPSIWSKVPAGTPVWVWKSSQKEEQKEIGQFLFECENGNIMATTGGYESEWKNARLVKPEDLYTGVIAWKE